MRHFGHLNIHQTQADGIATNIYTGLWVTQDEDDSQGPIHGHWLLIQEAMDSGATGFVFDYGELRGEREAAARTFSETASWLRANGFPAEVRSGPLREKLKLDHVLERTGELADRAKHTGIKVTSSVAVLIVCVTIVSHEIDHFAEPQASSAASTAVEAEKLKDLLWLKLREADTPARVVDVSIDGARSSLMVTVQLDSPHTLTPAEVLEIAGQVRALTCVNLGIAECSSDKIRVSFGRRAATVGY